MTDTYFHPSGVRVTMPKEVTSDDLREVASSVLEIASTKEPAKQGVAAEITLGTSGPLTVTNLIISTETATAEAAPAPVNVHAINAHMVELLNNDDFCAAIREIGCEGSFGTVIRNVAKSLAARGVKP